MRCFLHFLELKNSDDSKIVRFVHPPTGPLLFITGDQAHSREFSEDAYQRAAEPKELFYVKGAGHVDLYNRVNMIPFDKLDNFFTNNLK